MIYGDSEALPDWGLGTMAAVVFPQDKFFMVLNGYKFIGLLVRGKWRSLIPFFRLFYGLSSSPCYSIAQIGFYGLAGISGTCSQCFSGQIESHFSQKQYKFIVNLTTKCHSLNRR